ncbi:hypothetical protein ACFSSG_12200 [Euzebyella marina]|uniref:hypothetical protein n=1 Tax=Euzebyella marina TaxID=1761453 RepID=UPI001CE3953C|nr:hypothetical protein [Euzebyella marina]|tara:strand:+ start:3803 stop:4003 length:201 start_codon:yes stop_codon:yes gene_type:complete
MEQGDYGYLWEHKYFVVDGKQYNSYMASGNGGQKIIYGPNWTWLPYSGEVITIPMNYMERVRPPMR